MPTTPDLAIIGSGPAALTAAIYAARANLSVVIYERAVIGGMLPEISHIANYPGFDGSGADLAHQLKAQVQALGVDFRYEEVTSLYVLPGDESDAGATTAELTASSATPSAEAPSSHTTPSPLGRAVLIATGSEPRKLSFTPTPPVSYCALCDGPLYQGKNLLVIGGGNSAVGESLILADLANQVTLISHSPLKAEPTRVAELRARPNVTILENAEATPESTSAYDAIFVYIGKRPASALIDEKHRDELGFIITDTNSHHVAENIYAAGDVRAGSIKQLVTAAADGAAAAIEIITACHSESELKSEPASKTTVASEPSAKSEPVLGSEAKTASKGN